MSFLLTLIQAAGLGCASAAAGRRVMHYLQLESYQLPGYIKSVKRNAMRALIPPIAMAAVGVAALKVSGLFGLALLLEALTAALLAWQAAKEKAKKPFVATERVKRLTAVHAAVNTVLALILLLISPTLGYLMPAFEPALLMLAAVVAAPMEKHIAGQFVKDAQARLAAQPNLIKIGITGSYGKTSTKFLLRDILSVKYNVLATPSSFNTTTVSYTHLDVYKRQVYILDPYLKTDYSKTDKRHLLTQIEPGLLEADLEDIDELLLYTFYIIDTKEH